MTPSNKDADNGPVRRRILLWRLPRAIRCLGRKLDWGIQSAEAAIMQIRQTGGGGKKRILVVDDEQDVRKMIAQVLSMEGHLVDEAGDGADALAQFSKNTFDLVITDFRMPIMKGDELVEKIRRLVPGQRIIMVSANWPKLADPLSKVNLCLDKPFQIDELLLAVRNMLQDSN